MEVWYGVVILILLLVITALILKIYLLRKSVKEIEEGFMERLGTDTNTLIDISSRDRAVRSLANAVNTQLWQLKKERHRFLQGDLELKNAVTNISHDLRTPLTAIYGYLELLEQEEKSGAVERYIEIIKNRTEMLMQLTEELFRYSVILTAKNVVERERVDVGSVLLESIAAFYTALKKRGITPNIQMPEEKVWRNLDASALSRVFSNLLNNVVKYSDGDLDVTLKKSGEIIFANTASGLDEIQAGRLFDRFYTVETAGNSTGLGLAIARTLMGQMDGEISASYKNNRLIIRIFLPEKD